MKVLYLVTLASTPAFGLLTGPIRPIDWREVENKAGNIWKALVTGNPCVACVTQNRYRDVSTISIWIGATDSLVPPCCGYSV